jgi:hypothetical protein
MTGRDHGLIISNISIIGIQITRQYETCLVCKKQSKKLSTEKQSDKVLLGNNGGTNFHNIRHQ